MLDEREIYYITMYNSYKNGYNNHPGGANYQKNENNNNTKLTNEEVVFIRKAYNNHCRSKEIYNNFKNKISYSNFMAIWEGRIFSGIMSEVYTKENKEYYSKKSTNGELSPKAAFTKIKKFLKLEKDMLMKQLKKIYQDYKDRCSFGNF